MAARREARPEFDLARLYDEYGPRLYHYLLHRLGSAADAEDALQNLFLKLARMGGIAARSVPAYLFGAARNEALRLRQKRTAPPARAPIFVAPADDREALESALAKLPEEQAEVIVLKAWEGLTFQEIADGFGLPLDTVTSRYRYGVEKLRSMLGRGDEP